MAKKKYYDIHGNLIRSRPKNEFYHKWWFWLMIFTVLIIGIVILGGNEDIAEEPVASETAEVPEKNNEKVDEQIENTENVKEEATFTYENIQGTYAIFSGNPYESNINELYIFESDYFRYLNLWDMDLKSIITRDKIEGDILTLNFEGEENELWGVYDESGMEQFELRHEDSKQYLYSLTNDKSLYSISEQDLQEHYNQLEIDYARIVMTIIDGNIPRDAWAVSSPVTIYVSHSSADEPLGGWGGASSYPKDVTHLSSDFFDDLSHLSDQLKSGIITYSTQGDGNITLYQLNKDGAERVAQERIEEVGAMYVQPSEPHYVADFIGNVEFVYER